MKYTSLTGAGALKFDNVVSCSDASSYRGPTTVPMSVSRLLFRRRINRTLETRTLEHSEGAGELASGPSCKSSSPDVSVLPRCVLAWHFRGPGKLARARRGIVATHSHAMGGVNAEREQSAARGTFAGRVSRAVIIFRVSRARP